MNTIENNTKICPAKRIRTNIVQRPKSIVKRIRTDIVQRPKPAPMQLICPVARIDASDNLLPPGRQIHDVSFVDLVTGCRTKIADPSLDWLLQFMYEEDFNPGEIVFIDAVCAAGKNTYIEFLIDLKYFQNVLILANRRGNRDQIRNRLGIKDDMVFKKAEVISYQSLERNSDIWSEELESFDLLVIDEAHYFVKDALFNPRVNLSLEKILNTRNPVKIFMSATLEETQKKVLSRIKGQNRNYCDLSQCCSIYKFRKQKQNIDFVSCIDYAELISKIKASDPCERWLIFVDTKKAGNEIRRMFSDEAVFITSESSTSDPDASAEYKTIVSEERFNCRILIATSVLDNGVNFKDPSLRNIVIASNDRIEMKQMLGRKRCIDQNDSFALYLLYYERSEIAELRRNNLLEMKYWEQVRTYLYDNTFPPVCHSLNGDEGDHIRQTIFFDERREMYRFNHLGYYGLQIIAKDLKELHESEDIFLTKFEWLFQEIESPPICEGTSIVLEKKSLQIMKEVEEYIEKTFAVKSDEFTEFRNVFSQIFWKAFSVDGEEKHRTDRPLSASKINVACDKHRIPLKLIPSQGKVNGCRCTLYTIKPLFNS